MPHTDTTPVSATVATTGKGVVYVGGGYWTGYSGAVAINASEGTQFEFTSPHVGTVAKYIFSDTAPPGSNQYVAYIISLNDLVVFDARFFNFSAGVVDLDIPIEFVIPPLTEVKIIAKVAEAEAHTTYGMLMLKEV